MKKSFYKFPVLFFVVFGVVSANALVGTIASLAVNAAAKGQGNMCLKDDSKVGETITSPAGHKGLIKTISTSSPLCKNNMVQANVEFQFTYASKFKIDLPTEYDIKPLNEVQKYQGAIIIAAARFKRSTGISIYSRKKTESTDPLAEANAISEAQVNILVDAVSKNPEEFMDVGMDLWRYEVSGKVKGVFGPQMTYLTTVIDSKDELIIITQYAPQADYDKDLFTPFLKKISGLEPLDATAVQNKNRPALVALDSTNPTKTNLSDSTIINNSTETYKQNSFSSSAKKALVIGNDSYKSVAKLSNAREDARTIASNLNSLGYQVTLKLDLNDKEMKTALRAFAGQVEGGDEVLFYFAGHGVQLGAANYLLPTDIVGDNEAQVRDEATQLQRILDEMSERKAKFTLAMIDACRDNPFKSSARAIGGRGLAPTTAATGQMVIFSAGSGQQALDRLSNNDKNKNGLFARVLVQEMQKPNQTIDRVIKNVRNQVAEMAKSVGHEQVPAIYDQVIGDFYFRK